MKKNFLPLLLWSILILLTASCNKAPEKKMNGSDMTECELIKKYQDLLTRKMLEQEQKYLDAIGWDGKESSYSHDIAVGHLAVMEPFADHIETNRHMSKICGCE